MAIHIQNGKRGINSNAGLTENIHSIPFNIHADCDADVSKYFYQSSENELKYASFRGYPLIGKEIKLPEGYKGVVLHETIRPSVETQDRKFYILHTFNKFTYWNWGKIPSPNDALVQAIDWIDIAEALHSPITE
ncbi:ribonuclease H2 subunit C [Coccinella septempunctata]|uniref:ribonuclease H2 subunit C n=1 Tax=Coccinella septempunctata TaxID=41139 RepID=UPI001D08F89B|nr:ribonuclease H2 subunit C [Coccinella septempunctata]